MKLVLEFLEGLRANNTREWFEVNRKWYEGAKGEFEGMVNGLIRGIFVFDAGIGTLTARDCVFRIYRDVRFGKDKSPYKTNMGAYISRGGRKGMYAGYYVHVEPGGSMLAGGVYMPPPEVLKKVRQEVYYNAKEFKEILNKKEFRKTFSMMEDDKLSRAPKDFPADFEDIDLLKYKSYTVMHGMRDEGVTGKDFEDYALKVFRVMAPFNGFINRGIGN